MKTNMKQCCEKTAGLISAMKNTTISLDCNMDMQICCNPCNQSGNAAGTCSASQNQNTETDASDSDSACGCGTSSVQTTAKSNCNSQKRLASQKHFCFSLFDLAVTGAVVTALSLLGCCMGMGCKKK